MITALAICLLLLLIGMVTTNTKLKLRHQELLHQTLKNQKDQIDRLFHGMTQLIDRYAVGDLVNNRYEYREYSNHEALYPESGSYQYLIDEAAKKYFVLSDTENIKLNPSPKQRISSEGAPQRKRDLKDRIQRPNRKHL